MNPAKQQYLVDQVGNRVAVLLDIQEYQKMLEALEELEEINAYDEAKSANEEAVPFDQTVKEIESQRP